MALKSFNLAIGRPVLNVICGYEFAALNSHDRLHSITEGIWWLRNNHLGWLAWILVIGLLGWVGHHLLLEPTAGATVI